MDANELLACYAAGKRNFRWNDFSGANLFNANLSEIDLINADLSGANLSGADLSEATLGGACLKEANLSGVCLKEANLFNANLSGAYLSKAYLSRAYLSEAELMNADLSGAYLSEAELMNADLSGANLSGANLSGADLSEANLSGADLSGADLSGADLSGADLSHANLFKAVLINANVSGSKLDGTILGYQNFSEKLQQEKQELIDKIKLLETKLKNKIDFSQGLILGCREVLIAQQADFIQRLKSCHLLHCETENKHSELTIISGERLKQMRDFCWKMADKYKQKASVRDVFINNLKGKLGEVAIKTRLGDFITEVDYEERIRGDGKVDFRLKLYQHIGIQVKARHGSIDTSQWVISAEEIEKNSVLVCVLIQEEISEAQAEYHLILAGFLPTNMIKVKNGKARVAANELWYGGGLRKYLNLFYLF